MFHLSFFRLCVQIQNSVPFFHQPATPGYEPLVFRTVSNRLRNALHGAEGQGNEVAEHLAGDIRMRDKKGIERFFGGFHIRVGFVQLVYDFFNGAHQRRLP
jgi:hypothetical protein